MTIERPVRIAFLSEHASPVALLGSEDAGGQNVYVDEVSRNLGLQGYAVDIFTRRADREAPEIIEWAPNVRIINLAAGPARFLLKDELWPLMPQFRDAFLRFTHKQGISYDLIHGNFWMSGWVATELRSILGVPVVHIFHAMGKTKRQHQGKADTSPDERIHVELRVIKEVDHLIAQCPAERDELVADYGTEADKVALIPSAVNVKRFYPVSRGEARRRLDLPRDGLVVVYVGRMVPRKGVRNLVRGTARLIHDSTAGDRPSLPPITLLLVGGETADANPAATPEIGVLQQLAEELGIAEHVRFAGKQQPELLRYFYSAGDVAVTTPWYEPFGLTPLEAMACGRPVIGSAVGGITYTVQDGHTGLLVPPRNPGALADALYRLLSDPHKRASMGQAARARVERYFTWPTVARRTAALYERVLQEQEPLPTDVSMLAAAGGR